MLYDLTSKMFIRFLFCIYMYMYIYMVYIWLCMWHGIHMWKSEDKKLGIQFSSFTIWVSLFKLQIELRLGGNCLYLLATSLTHV